jgi:hypothetical protein
MAIDFNKAPPQREGGELIPDGTVAVCHLTVRPGGVGDGGWLKRSKEGSSSALDCEFTIVEGLHAKRKFWKLYTVDGTTEGHAKAAEISVTQLRAIWESARGIQPLDESDAARAARNMPNGWADLDGLRFIGKVGIEKGTGGYKDKNTLAYVVTPDKKDWRKVEQVASTPAPIAAPQQAAAVPAGKPSWAA